LGLLVAKNIVADHGGTLQVRSAVNEGTTFTVHLPTIGLNPADEMLSEPIKSTRILIAGDEQAIPLILRQPLESEGYEVIEATDGAEFMTQFDLHGTDLRAVVLDVKMPGKSGWQCFEELGKVAPDQPVLMISGDDPEGPMLDAPDKAHRCLAKPFRMAEVKSALTDLISARSGQIQVGIPIQHEIPLIG
jgi:CheY-like chemotaxis protein